MAGFNRRTVRYVSPVKAAFYGAAGGLVGTIIITLLARIIPGIRTESKKNPKEQLPKLPDHPFKKETVIEWQDRSRSPAAYSLQVADGPAQEIAIEHAAAVTPAGALAEAQGPGPEGAAEYFIVKVGSGLFDRDFARYSKPAGKILHLVYGSFCGLVYGILQGQGRRNVWLAGTVHGFLVWSVGPGSLVPAMRLMLPPWKAPKRQTAVMVAGHIVYGVVVAQLFDVQVRRRK
jgi:hypothetical protein